MDLDKLNSQISSMKDMDVAQLTKVMTEHQNTVIKAVLVIGSLALVFFMFNDYQKKTQALHSQVSLVQAKISAIKANNAALEDFKNFQSALPKKLNEIELITLISNYAKMYRISISSLNPAEGQDKGLYDVINVGFNAGADDYRTMMLFLRKIEKSEFPLRIDAWSGHQETGGKVDFVVNISAVLIHQ